MSHPQDHFSDLSEKYKIGRIEYPDQLYAYLFSACEGNGCAWDSATGSGQAARDLAIYFDQVIATDISAPLLSEADAAKNVAFRVAPAEDSGLASGSVDLVTVAQAIHWFDLDRFWQEVRRVLKPGGIFAYWGYVWPQVNDSVDGALEQYRELIAEYWPDRSQYVHAYYAEINAPFERLRAPEFEVVRQWKVGDYLAHLASWSGTRYFCEKFGDAPLEPLRADLIACWGDDLHREVRWPLVFKAYRV